MLGGGELLQFISTVCCEYLVNIQFISVSALIWLTTNSRKTGLLTTSGADVHRNHIMIYFEYSPNMSFLSGLAPIRIATDTLGTLRFISYHLIDSSKNACPFGPHGRYIPVLLDDVLGGRTTTPPAQFLCISGYM